MTVFNVVMFRVVTQILSSLGLGGHGTELWLLAPVVLLARIAMPVAGGYVAAWSYRKAPLLAAVTLGLACWALNVVALVMYAGDSSHAFHHFRSAVFAIVLATAGGLLRVWKRRPVLG
jgi:hypothetical protein